MPTEPRCHLMFRLPVRTRRTAWAERSPGLIATGLVLSDASDTYLVPANAANFTMPTAVAYGSGYTVSVQRQPAGLTCTVSGGTGTMSASAVMNVEVTCASSSYTSQDVYLRIDHVRAGNHRRFRRPPGRGQRWRSSRCLTLLPTAAVTR